MSKNEQGINNLNNSIPIEDMQPTEWELKITLCIKNCLNVTSHNFGYK